MLEARLERGASYSRAREKMLTRGANGPKREAHPWCERSLGFSGLLSTIPSLFIGAARVSQLETPNDFVDKHARGVTVRDSFRLRPFVRHERSPTPAKVRWPDR